MARTRRQAWHLAFVVSAVLFSGCAALEVEHAFGGSGFRPVGKLIGDLHSDTEVEWQRPALTSDDMELLQKAADSEGLYSVRLKTDRGTLLSSVPAKCLLLDNFAEQVVLHAGRDGFIEAFNYDVKHCSSSSLAAAAAAAAAATAGSSVFGVSGGAGDDGSDGVAARPERLGVRVQRPAPGPMLTLPELLGDFADVSVDIPDLASSGLGPAAFDPNAKPRAVPGGGGPGGVRKGGPPPKDERTWLQKNWLFVVAAGMMVMNLLAKANAPPPPQQGGPAAAAGAGRRG